jgi:hypothetical protein
MQILCHSGNSRGVWLGQYFLHKGDIKLSGTKSLMATMKNPHPPTPSPHLGEGELETSPLTSDPSMAIQGVQR